jgi:hypothetical protein
VVYLVPVLAAFLLMGRRKPAATASPATPRVHATSH